MENPETQTVDSDTSTRGQEHAESETELPDSSSDQFDPGLQRVGLGFLILLCCIGFLIADVLTAHLFDDPFPAMIILNVITAQLTLVCVWGTLVQGTFWVRLPWTLLLLVVSWCALAVGAAWEFSGTHVEQVLGIGFLWSFGFVASFVPLKIAAVAFGWRIVQTSTQGEQLVQYSIRDMMIGTLLLAVTMAIGRAVLPDEPIDLQLALRSSGLGDGEPLFAICVFGVISLLVKLPCIWIALAQDNEKLPASIAIWSGYCVILTILELAVLSIFLGVPSGESGLVLGMLIGHQLMGGIVLAVCLALRGLGYRLQRALKPAQ